MALQYTDVRTLWRILGFNGDIMSYQAGNTPERDTLAESPVAAGKYYFRQPNVNPHTIELFPGTSQVPLTPTTDYTINELSNSITITSTGAAKLTAVNLTAEYEFCTLDTVDYDITYSALQTAEKEFESHTEQTFTTPNLRKYREILNEEVLFPAQTRRIHDTFTTRLNPLVIVNTTVAEDYTTADEELMVTDASLLPDSGWVYAGGIKVQYSAKTGNDLTVVGSYPNIDADEMVSNFITEISYELDGLEPQWQLLRNEDQFSLDGRQGLVKIYRSSLFIGSAIHSMRTFSQGLRIRFTYNQAWLDESGKLIIPDDAVEAMYMIAARILRRRAIMRSHIGQRDNFQVLASSETTEFIESMYDEYSVQRTHIR